LNPLEVESIYYGNSVGDCMNRVRSHMKE